MSQRRTTEYLRIADLHLDPRNYRLPAGLELEDEHALAAYLERNYDLNEIGESIAEEGYRPEEPLIAVVEDDQLVVAEGNRRLATLKLLTEVEYRETLGPRRRDTWDALADRAQRNADAGGWDISEVPAVIYEDRSQIAGSLGFRHVSGIAPWSPESKARYIADLVRHGLDFKEVARKVGSRTDYVRRQYVAHRALVEAREKAEIDTSRAERFFGVYYRSLSNPGNRAFVGLIDWSQEIDPSQLDTVFAKEHADFGEYLSFLFGSSSGEGPVITDSRQVDLLGRVLADTNARQVLRSERDLQAALDVLGTDKQSVFNDLRQALGRLRRANGAAWEFKGDDELLDIAIRCVQTSERIVEQLKSEDIAAV